ncbi:IucA/IucC family C-terminal-domain containing protein [Bacillus sp. FJAT-27251]|uniref:IucA/IucC family C-terminal-domain containing protein n=1 Tax=Bacillus sp. FJAT-27251 TaxID=1684142 RepID=UPI0006A7643C|nr:IucA/IucC family C-terminal-domain containing protein [Bacillus sp. FJAT-27251]
MSTEMTPQEREELSRFRYTPELKDRDKTNIGALLEEEALLSFLEGVKQEIQAPDLRVAASVFTKYFAFIPVIYLYSLSAWDKKLAVSLDQLWLQSNERDGKWLPEYFFQDVRVEKRADEDRNAWRDEALKHLFSEIVFPIVDQLSTKMHLSRYILWENISVYISWLYRNILNPAEAPRAAEDFEYLVQKAPGRLFGPYDRNPLQLYHAEPEYLEEASEHVYVRKTCCLTYKLGEKRTYCRTCPLYCRKFNKGKRNRNEY